MRRFFVVIFILFTYIAFGCSVEINVSYSEINVKQGSTNIPNNTGYFNFGYIPLNFNQSVTFTIESIGLQGLQITNPKKVVLTGQNKDDFIASTNQTEVFLNPNNETTFKIIFFPKSLGKKIATVVIENSDSDKNPYTFVIVGTCTSPAPEIQVKINDNDILCKTGSYDFGSAILNTTSQYIDVMIYNIGNKDLWLTGYPSKVSISGANATMFVFNDVSTYPVITSGNHTSFKLAFQPTSPGIKSAKVSILNNDSDENPFTFTVTGICGAASEINVKQGIQDIPCTTGSYVFDDVLINESSQEVIFTIENLGSTNLHLTDSPKFVTITGTDATMFSVNVSGIKEYLGPGETTTFKLKFEPTKPGMIYAEVNIPNIDNNENPYIFKVSGKCIEPEINVKYSSVDIPSGSGTYNFGYCITGTTSFIQTFTIENKGTGDLKLTDTPRISISGSDQAMFTVDQTSTTSPIEQGRFTTFKVSFKPTSNGSKSAKISIANNDFDEDPYEFTLTGSGIDYISGMALGWIGGGYNGWQQSNGTSISANYNSFYNPYYVFLDTNNNIYVADSLNSRICKWSSNGSAIGWIGGGSNGWKQTSGANPGSDFRSFRRPYAVFVDSSGTIFVADSNNHRVCKWDSAGNAIGWIGGGSSGWKTSSGANSHPYYQSFHYPNDLYVDSAGNIYVADTSNHRISKWSAQGNAQGWIGDRRDGWHTTNASYSGYNDYKSFDTPYGVTLDSSGNIYVCDSNNNRVCKWNNQGYAQGWIGGGLDGWQTSYGTNVNSSYKGFNNPRRIFVTSSGYLYIADTYNARISKWNSSGNAVGWIGGGNSGWQTSSAPYTNQGYRYFNYPGGIFVTSNNTLFIADSVNNRICKWID